jgi:hypothetical protein
VSICESLRSLVSSPNPTMHPHATDQTCPQTNYKSMTPHNNGPPLTELCQPNHNYHTNHQLRPILPIRRPAFQRPPPRFSVADPLRPCFALLGHAAYKDQAPGPAAHLSDNCTLRTVCLMPVDPRYSPDIKWRSFNLVLGAKDETCGFPSWCRYLNSGAWDR